MPVPKKAKEAAESANKVSNNPDVSFGGSHAKKLNQSKMLLEII